MLLGALPPAGFSALVFMTLGELAIAFSDVVIDGVVVERSRGEEQATAGSLQSICWGSQVGVEMGCEFRAVMKLINDLFQASCAILVPSL